MSAPARPRRRGLRAFSTVLIVTGALLVADAGVTLLWQEPLSWLYARIQQGDLAVLQGLLREHPELATARMKAVLAVNGVEA